MNYGNCVKLETKKKIKIHSLPPVEFWTSFILKLNGQRKGLLNIYNTQLDSQLQSVGLISEPRYLE